MGFVTCMPRHLPGQAWVTAFTVRYYLCAAAQSGNLADSGHVAAIPLQAELEVFVGIRTMGVNSKLWCHISPQPNDWYQCDCFETIRHRCTEQKQHLHVGTGNCACPYFFLFDNYRQFVRHFFELQLVLAESDFLE